jgi:methionyl-tRNA synthetase
MNTNHKRILVTSALPYANGQIHIGHLVEYIQTDIWVRFQRMLGHEIYYVGADDTHGTPIMLRAQSENISPQELINRVWYEHKGDFDDFLVSFDHYGSTNSPENKDLSEQIYLKLQANDLIEKKSIEQAYDPVKEMFLPDRFIKGECPKCHSKDQYGDSCEKCGTTYSPTDLINPYSVVSGATPIRKVSEHYFFKLSDPRCETFLRQWTQVETPLQPEARNKMKEWVGESGESKLSNWDISRDEPYFGFEIPGAPGKYFYVWLDAPIGYFASFKALCAQKGLDFEEWIKPSTTTEMYHFIGKDILYFHTLFWPATLHFSGYRTPSNVFAHGFLTVDGEKMSKSRGTFITARSFINSGLNPEWLRYYFAAKLNASLEDLDLNLQDFTARVNSDLLGKYINIASRSSGFLVKRFGGKIASAALQHPLIKNLKEASSEIADLYEGREFAKAQRKIMELADEVNVFVDTNKPWEIAKSLTTEDHPETSKRLQEVCSITLEAFRILTLYLKPVLPELAKNVETFLNIEPLSWSSVDHSLGEANTVAPYQHLMSRVDPKMIDALIEANKTPVPVSS